MGRSGGGCGYNGVHCNEGWFGHEIMRQIGGGGYQNFGHVWVGNLALKISILNFII